MRGVTGGLILAFCALGVFVAAGASAAPITFFDIDSYGGMVMSATGLSSLGGEFDITEDGIESDTFTIGAPYFFRPLTLSDAGGFEVGIDKAVAASVFLAVRDDGRDWAELLEVELGNLSTRMYEVDFGILARRIGGSLLAKINESGRLSYELTARSGDFAVDFAALRVRAISPVPEPAAAVVFGVGLLVVGEAVRRNRRRR